jgi:hypothetical protein
MLSRQEESAVERNYRMMGDRLEREKRQKRGEEWRRKTREILGA